jgi:hypothetical protein
LRQEVSSSGGYGSGGTSARRADFFRAYYENALPL